MADLNASELAELLPRYGFHVSQRSNFLSGVYYMSLGKVVFAFSDSDLSGGDRAPYGDAIVACREEKFDGWRTYELRWRMPIDSDTVDELVAQLRHLAGGPRVSIYKDD